MSFTIGLNTSTTGGPGSPPTTAGQVPNPFATGTAGPTISAASDVSPSPDTPTPTISATPVAGNAFRLTSTNGVLLGGVGGLVIIAGAVLGLVGYRRRSYGSTSD